MIEETDYDSADNPDNPERLAYVVNLFDEADDRGAGEDQWKLTGLAMLLSRLELIEVDGRDFTVPIVAKLRALQAAYWLGSLKSSNENHLR